MTAPIELPLPGVRDMLDAHGLNANKGLGQHFLFDLNITRKIVRLGGPFTGQRVIEIGPGPGGLTRALLETAPAQLIVIEKDARFLPLLAEIASAADALLIVHEADALKADEPQLLALHNLISIAKDNHDRAHIVSNLPYNVGTPLLIKWMTGPWQPLSMTLMFQLEVAQRIVAPTGSEAYGRLAVLSQILCDTDLIMTVPARAFTPPPKVDSAVVRLVPHQVRPEPHLIRALEKITAAAFGQRRKMLRAALKPLGGEDLLKAAGLDPTWRAEQVSPENFLMLARVWTDSKAA